MGNGSLPRSLTQWLGACVVATLLISIPACGRTSHAHATHDKDEAREVAAGHDHAHDHDRPSDLDRPVSELFESVCEHEIRAFTCEECRFEVGVVRAPDDLVRQGLFEVVQPSLQTVAFPVELTAEVRFDERRVAHVRPVAPGVIRKVHVMVGDQVKAGVPLVEIESVAAGDAHGDMLEARARLQLAERAFERADSLRKGGLASEKDYLEAKTELDAARIRAEAAKGRLHRLGGTGAGTIVLRAAVDGSVLELHAVPGELASPDESLATVGNNGAVWVWADLYERDIAKVMNARASGDLSAAVFVEAYPGESFPGTVDLISPSMDRSSRTVKTRIAVDNAGGRLLAGMFAKVHVFLPGETRALALPRSSVLEDEGRKFVFLHHREDYYVRRSVEVGRSWAGWVEITSGVSPDQHVVGRGAFLMKSDVLRSKMGAGCAD
jgi:cobalt-zinc-cadmium efflux system membrane fusion protein